MDKEDKFCESDDYFCGECKCKSSSSESERTHSIQELHFAIDILPKYCTGAGIAGGSVYYGWEHNKTCLKCGKPLE